MNEFDLMKEKIMDAVKEGKTDIEIINIQLTAIGIMLGEIIGILRTLSSNLSLGVDDGR